MFSVNFSDFDNYSADLKHFILVGIPKTAYGHDTITLKVEVI
jgi:hypothetical protein